MKLFKDYTKDFERIYEEIEDVKTYVRGKNDKTLIAINNIAETTERLEKQYDQLASEIVEIKQLIMNQTPTGKVTETIEIAEKENHYKKGGHISTYAHFRNYKTPRQYDLNYGAFKSLKGNGHLKLNFEQLVAIIKAYKADLPVKKMKQNPILNSFTNYAIQGYIYIWRAGGFNQAIKDTARKLGYNPNKLISLEVEENV